MSKISLQPHQRNPPNNNCNNNSNSKKGNTKKTKMRRKIGMLNNKSSQKHRTTYNRPQNTEKRNC